MTVCKPWVEITTNLLITHDVCFVLIIKLCPIFIKNDCCKYFDNFNI